MEGRNGYIEKILEEYEKADRKKRVHLWLMFFELRGEFDKTERHGKYSPRKFGVDPSAVCCGG